MTVTQIHATGEQVRRACRTGAFRGTTAGQGPGHIQANLIILPQRYANDFRGLCRRNPVACPLLGENVAPGDWRLQQDLAADSDVRADAPGYNVYRDGKLIEADIPDIKHLWQADSVAFLIGCSFSFDNALRDSGLTPRHEELGRNVPMYKTKIPLCPSGVFGGNMVVSMRPYKPEDIERVRDITRPYERTHGEPVAWGLDAAAKLGISDVHSPEFGEAPVIEDGEIPVFWACGVTPQLSVMSSPDVKGICIGHAPGKMIVLDIKQEDLLQ